MFTAAAVPAAIGAALGALRIIRSPEGPELMERLRDNARYLERGLEQLGFTVVGIGSEVPTPIVPVLIGDDWEAALMWKALFDAGVYVNVALYPAVERGSALLRTSVMATHEREQLDRALDAFDRCRPQGS
jgi:8-amino-7-oxononanoate synthase